MRGYAGLWAGALFCASVGAFAQGYPQNIYLATNVSLYKKMAAFFRREVERCAKVIKAGNVRVE